jgi:hypothetical protein
MWRLVQLSMVLGVLSSLTCPAQTQAPPGNYPMSKPPNSDVLSTQAPEDSHSPGYREMDLLKGFATASKAVISFRIVDDNGLTPAGLPASDFIVTVNGTKRAVRLHSPGSTTSTVQPLVLLVFPPNEPVVHHIAVTQARKYFSAQAAELLPWKVGIFDSNGELTPFNNGRSQLLAELDIIDHASEPFEYASDFVLPKGARWDGGWRNKAQEAVGTMQSYGGPKIVLAMNPLSEPIYGAISGYLAHDGPDSLVRAARQIGAHIYIANVGGPDTLVPGGDVSQDEQSQVNMSDPNTIVSGNVPVGVPDSMRMDSQLSAIHSVQDRTSQMMRTAASTLGGFSNSFKDLAAQIHRDLDNNYSLDFDLTPEDQDRGLRSIEIRPVRRDLRIKILDIVPVGRTPAMDDGGITPQQLAKFIHRVDQKPVSSIDFRVSQHVDYFPLHGGLAPVLPMSASIDWTGSGQAPRLLSFVESIEDLDLLTTMVSRDIRAHWDGHRLSWERDDQLRPGHYIWRVIVHDDSGNILASAQERIAVDFPREVSLRESSLVLGASCLNPSEATGGLKKRPSPASAEREQSHLLIDPLRIADCRIQPESSGVFTSTDQLHALVRIYPDEKYKRQRPESWTAKFVLRSKDGAVEEEKEVQFLVDSGSGYLASVEMPLDSPRIETGLHTVDVETRGPGIHGDLKQSRTVLIQIGQ